MKVAVVGAGIMGASTALALVDRGHNVTVFDPHDVAEGLGSSHGRSRIVRRAYPDPFYTEIMQVAYPMWAELESRAGEAILHECGLLYFGLDSSKTMADVVLSLAANGVLHEVLDAQESKRRFPHLHLDANEIAVWTAEAGWVHAEKAVRASLRLAGITPIREQVSDPRELAKTFDRVCVCAGAWNLEWFSIDATVTRQTFAYVVLPERQVGPVWIEDSADFLYGFPSEPGGEATAKIGVHNPGPVQDPEKTDRPPGEREMDLIREFARKRFGVEGELASAHGCLYTTTPNEDFRFGSEDRLFWGSACSGHGFKFGPWVGKLMADFVEGKRHPSEYPRFT